MGFLSASGCVDVWFVINRLLDIVFLIDMALQFCVVYQQASDRAADKDAMWVTERRKIVRHYLLGWFPLDVLSIAPSVFDIIPIVEAAQQAAACGTSNVSEKLSGFRVIRAMRLIKLVRLVRASRLLSRWQARIGLSHSAITSLRIFTLVLVSAHWVRAPTARQASRPHAG